MNALLFVLLAMAQAESIYVRAQVLAAPEDLQKMFDTGVKQLRLYREESDLYEVSISGDMTCYRLVIDGSFKSRLENFFADKVKCYIFRVVELSENNPPSNLR